MNEGTIRRAESHSRTKKPSHCVHHCKDMSSGYSLLSVDSCWWNSGNCASTGTLMVRRRRWALRDTAHRSCKSEGRICRGEETRMRRQETGKTAKELTGLEKSGFTMRRQNVEGESELTGWGVGEWWLLRIQGHAQALSLTCAHAAHLCWPNRAQELQRC